MTNEEQAKWEEREAWERFALKALEFVPIQKNGEAYEPGQMTRRAASIATALVRERRDAFNELDIWPEQGELRETQEQSATFPDELVERLAKSGSPDWEYLPDYMQERRRRHARAILSELASMSCELPTSEPIAHTLDSCDGAGQSTNFAKSMWLAQWLRDTLSPILAAKDAEFARLKYEAADMERLANARLTDVDMVEDKLRHEMECAAKRIAELESKLTAVERSVEWGRQEMVAASVELGFSGSTIEEAVRKKNKAHDDDKMRIAEFQARFEQDQEALHMAHQRIAELEKRIAELTAPVDVDGKTPGQVGHAAWQKKFHEINGGNGAEWQEETVRVRECEEASASAVLRTFGNGAEVLKMVRDRIEKSRIDSFAARQETPVQYAANAAYRYSMEFIDAEIANIEGVKVPVADYKTGDPKAYQ